MRGNERFGRFVERERENKPGSAVFEWLGVRPWALARTANAVRVPAGMFSLIAYSGVILFVSGISNLIEDVVDEFHVRVESLTETGNIINV